MIAVAEELSLLALLIWWHDVLRDHGEIEGLILLVWLSQSFRLLLIGTVRVAHFFVLPLSRCDALLYFLKNSLFLGIRILRAKLELDRTSLRRPCPVTEDT